MPKTKAEIIQQEFEDVYVKFPGERAFHPIHGCEYLSKKGKRCIVGRCMIDPRSHVGSVKTIFESRKGLDAALRPEYRGHELAFWESLQALHDLPMYWEPDGLSELGKQKLASIKEKYSN